MYFKHPQILFFLFALAIPVIVHLFSFRKYVPVFFHNIHLLKSIRIEQNKTYNKLKRLLILSMRLLAFAALIVAFAQPRIAQKNAEQRTSSNAPVVLYIDNSFSMQAQTAEGSALDNAKNKAHSIVKSYPATQQFRLISNNGDVSEYQNLTQEQIRQKITTIQPSAFPLALSSVYKKAQEIAHESKSTLRLFFISDFQKITSDFENIPADSSVQLHCVPVFNTSFDNISVDSCWFDSPFRLHNAIEKLHITVNNRSDAQRTNTAVKLFINDTLKSLTSVNLEPRKQQTVDLEFVNNSQGATSGRVEIDDYPILYDNTYYFSFNKAAHISIAHIYSGLQSSNIAALFKNDFFKFQSINISALDYASLAHYDCIILDQLPEIPSGLLQMLVAASNQGKNIVAIPNKTSNIQSYNTLLAQFGNQRITEQDTAKISIARVDFRHQIFANVFEKTDKETQLPFVRNYFRIDAPVHTHILSLANNYAALLQLKQGKGSLFLFTMPFNAQSTNFTQSPLVMAIFNMALYVSQPTALAYTLGEPFHIAFETKQTDHAFHIVNRQLQVDIIPQFSIDYSNFTVKLNPMNMITQAGTYSVMQRDSTIAYVSFNYDRSESQAEFFSADEITQLLQSYQLSNASLINASHENLEQNVRSLDGDTELWRWFVLVALLCLIGEVFIIRFWK
ncbi:MAG: BatA and WFA domain-containing protein [Bacteroidetes bacterium]|nr:BatA and WFA domain-containing protein [Bacteroidota bacterium]